MDVFYNSILPGSDEIKKVETGRSTCKYISSLPVNAKATLFFYENSGENIHILFLSSYSSTYESECRLVLFWFLSEIVVSSRNH